MGGLVGGGGWVGAGGARGTHLLDLDELLHVVAARQGLVVQLL